MLVHAFLDIDGVLLGKRDGQNFPFPSDVVKLTLEQFLQAGHQLTFCTGRGAFATAPLIRALRIPGPHIADGGGVVFDPLGAGILRQLAIPPHLLSAPYEFLKSLGLYVSLISNESIHVEHGVDREKLCTYERIAGISASFESSLQDRFFDTPVNRLFFIVDSEEEKLRFADTLMPFQKELELTWSSNPNAEPHIYGWFTQKNVSKGEALQYVLQICGERERLLIGAGDNANDWDFLSLCNEIGIMGNASESLKMLARTEEQTKHNKHIVWLPHVNDDGIVPFLQECMRMSGE